MKWSLIVALAGVLCFAGCGGGEDGEQTDAGVDSGTTGGGQDAGSDAGVTTVSFATHVQPIFNAKCTSCHAGNAAGGLDLTSGAAYQELLAEGTAAAGCGIAQRVVAGEPNNSLLYLKVSNTQPAACGSGMPSGNSPLPAAELDTIRNWITQGAANN